MLQAGREQRYTIGVVRETKEPPDTRVPLTPAQCVQAVMQFGDRIRIVVERCPTRCYADREYEEKGIRLVDSAHEADMLLGVKEVSLDSLLHGRTYIMFSHTIKKQLYNRPLLQAMLARQVRLLDWECMADDCGLRVIAFGRWAGLVGAHNSVMTWGRRTGRFSLSRLKDTCDWATAIHNYRSEVCEQALRGLRVVLTGDGRVSSGCCEGLEALGLRRVSPDEFLAADWTEADAGAYTQLPASRLYRREADGGWDEGFFADPAGYASVVWPFVVKGNVLINGIYWDSRCPPLFTLQQMTLPQFGVKVIGDITCDIAPRASIPSTVRPSTIASPIYGFDPSTGQEVEPHAASCIDVMAVDNLPNELPRDASHSFGEMFLDSVLPEIVKPLGASRLVNDATIADAGKLTDKFSYLQDYVS